MAEDLRSGAARYATSIAVLVVTLAVAGFGIVILLPHQVEVDRPGIRSLKDLTTAFALVQPGTRASALGRLGFDVSSPNAQVLSYLGVMEHFTARNTVAFDQLAPAIRDCIDARDRCTALVFKPSETVVREAGMFSMFGIDAAKAAAEPAEVTLLVQDGRVAYKTIRGLPAEHRTAVAFRTSSY